MWIREKWLILHLNQGKTTSLRGGKSGKNGHFWKKIREKMSSSALDTLFCIWAQARALAQTQSINWFYTDCIWAFTNLNVIKFQGRSSKVHDHIKIKMSNPSQETPASSKAPNQDLKDIDVLCTFKIKIESPILNTGLLHTSDHIQIKINIPNPS